MAIDRILWAIEEEAQEEANQIIAEAEAAAQKTVVAAKAHAEEIKERYYRQRVLPELRAEEARLIGEAQRESLGMVMKVKEELIDRAFTLAAEELSKVRSRGDYPEILHRLTQEVVGELGKELIIEVSPQDSELIEKIVSEVGLDATVRFSLECMGGLAAAPQDGRVHLVNTIDSRLERAREFLREQVAAIVAEAD